MLLLRPQSHGSLPAAERSSNLCRASRHHPLANATSDDVSHPHYARAPARALKHYSPPSVQAANELLMCIKAPPTSFRLKSRGSGAPGGYEIVHLRGEKTAPIWRKGTVLSATGGAVGASETRILWAGCKLRPGKKYHARN